LIRLICHIRENRTVSAIMKLSSEGRAAIT
jgi:hypothetical protein